MTFRQATGSAGPPVLVTVHAKFTFVYARNGEAPGNGVWILLHNSGLTTDGFETPPKSRGTSTSAIKPPPPSVPPTDASPERSRGGGGDGEDEEGEGLRRLQSSSAVSFEEREDASGARGAGHRRSQSADSVLSSPREGKRRDRRAKAQEVRGLEEEPGRRFFPRAFVSPKC